MNNFSTSYYQINKERLQKFSRERYQSLCGEEKEKGKDMLANDIKIFPNMKNKG